MEITVRPTQKEKIPTEPNSVVELRGMAST